MMKKITISFEGIDYDTRQEFYNIMMDSLIEYLREHPNAREALAKAAYNCLLSSLTMLRADIKIVVGKTEIKRLIEIIEKGCY